MSLACKDLQDEGKRLLQCLDAAKDEETKKSFRDAVSDLNLKIIALYRAAGCTIKYPEKLRIEYSRGPYYNHEVAEWIRNTFVNHITEPCEIPHPNGTLVRKLRQGMDFLIENLDPTNEVERWYNKFQFSQRREKVYILHRKGDHEIPVIHQSNWKLQINSWASSQGDLPPLWIPCASLQQYEDVKEFIKKLPGVTVLGRDGMRVQIGLEP